VVEKQEWWEASSAWLVELQGTAFDWRHIFACSLALMDAGRFVTFDQLRRLQAATGLSINPAIVRPLERQLQNSDHDFSVDTETKYVLTENGTLIYPTEFLDRNIVDMRSLISEASSCLAVDRAMSLPFATSLRILTQALQEVPAGLCISGEVELTDPESIESKLGNMDISQCVELLFYPDDLSELSPVEILSAGEKEIIRQIFRIARRLGCADPLPCVLNPRFMPSLSASAILHDDTGMRTLFRRCAEIVAGIALSVRGARLEPIRESRGGNAAQLVRLSDQATAWRTSLTMGGVGWRLNFCRSSHDSDERSQTIEFAIVEKKTSRVFIPE
jgi:hypothetical protein